MHALTPAGWSPIEPLGRSYMIEDDDHFDWQRTDPGELDRISRALDAPENAALHIGISLYRKDVETGGTPLLYPGRAEASFTPASTGGSIPDHPEMTDLPRYLQELLPALSTIGLTGYQAGDPPD